MVETLSKRILFPFLLTIALSSLGTARNPVNPNLSKDEIADSVMGYVAIVVEENVHDFVDDKFDWISIPRMIYHSIFWDDQERKEWWGEELSTFFTKEFFINHISEKLNSFQVSKKDIILKSIHESKIELLTDNLYDTIRLRESLEWKDLLYTFLVWLGSLVVVCLIFSMLYVMLFNSEPDDMPGCWWIFNSLLSIGITWYVVYNYIIVPSIELEEKISELLIDNIYTYLSTLNIIEIIIY